MGKWPFGKPGAANMWACTKCGTLYVRQSAASACCGKGG